jgi:hypothetical protein
MWIGFSRQEIWDGFAVETKHTMAAGGGDILQIGGKLVADPSHHLGFYFDPGTTEVAEVTIIEAQTSLDILKRNPEEAARSPFLWFIPCDYREGCKP